MEDDFTIPDDLSIPTGLRRSAGEGEGAAEFGRQSATENATGGATVVDSESATETATAAGPGNNEAGQVCRANLAGEGEQHDDDGEHAGEDHAELYRRAGEAWQQLKANAGATWDLHLIIGEAMLTARTEIMYGLQINKPYGQKYQKRWKAWLHEHHLADMNKTTRSLLIKLIEHRAEVDEMMASWSDAERADRNSPNTITHAWKEWRKEQGRDEPKTTKKPAELTRKDLAKTVEALEAYVAELLEAAREMSPPVVSDETDDDLPFDVDADGVVRLVDTDGQADRNQFQITIDAMFESNDRVTIVCENDGVISEKFAFVRADCRNGADESQPNAATGE